jgi:putative FmdB family regulatory protein
VYRCRSCETDFELDRPMRESSAPATCPSGHTDSLRVLSAFAAVGGGAASAPAPGACGVPAASMGCGGGCACH